MLKSIFFFIMLVAAIVIVPFTSMAQPPDPCPDPNAPDCPIDSNLALLVVAATGVAAKKAYDHKKKALTVVKYL